MQNWLERFPWIFDWTLFSWVSARVMSYLLTFGTLTTKPIGMASHTLPDTPPHTPRSSGRTLRGMAPDDAHVTLQQAQRPSMVQRYEQSKHKRKVICVSVAIGMVVLCAVIAGMTAVFLKKQIREEVQQEIVHSDAIAAARRTNCKQVNFSTFSDCATPTTLHIYQL